MPDYKASLDEVPFATVKQRPRISLIWFIPLFAALIGGWLIYKVKSEHGEIFTVIFNEAEGIEANKTPVRYKDVIVGKVKNVALADDLKKVHVDIQLNSQMSEHLGPKTRFWVFRPRVSINEVSGLSTLLSGIYISMDPGEPGEDQDTYIGLEEPPRITTHSEGQTFILQADRLGSLDAGSPVYYRQIRVGEVIKYELNADDDLVDISIFIRAPFHDLVRANSRFWNISGLDLEVTSAGVSAKMGSLASLLLGGITFETPHNLQVRLPVKKDSIFSLYESEKAANDKARGERLFYVMHFEGSLRGLDIGSTIEYRGIPVGKVEDVKLMIDPEGDNVKIPVLVSFYVDQFSVFGDRDDAEKALHSLVATGLRAQMKTANLLTGSQFIALSKPDNEQPVGEIAAAGTSDLSYAEFPTMQGLSQQLTRSATDILEQVNLGVRDIRRLINSPDIADSMGEISKIVKSTRILIAKMSPELVKSAEMVSGVVGHVDELILEAKPELVDTLKEVKDTVSNTNELIHRVKPGVVRSVDSFSSTLEQTSGLLSAVRNDVLDITHSLKNTMQGADLLVGQVNQEIMPLSNQVKKTMASLDYTLQAAQNTLENASVLLSEDSAMQYELRVLIEEVTQAANAFSVLADTLQRQPNSVIFGK